MSEPTKLDYTPGDFDDPNRIRVSYSPPNPWAFEPPPPFGQRLLAVRKEELEQRPPRMPFAAARPQPEASFTYLIGAEGSKFVKIGWARVPESRVAALQTGNPLALSVLWQVEGPYEGRLHTEFAPYRVLGEWFDFTELGDPVEAVTAAVERIKATENPE